MFQNQLSSVSVKKDNAFNFIRLVCCLIVIYQHTLVFSKGVMPLLSLNFAGGGYSLSVIIFFLISGFWVTKSYCSSASIKSYFAKRAKKILPLYYLVVFVFAFLPSFLPAFLQKNILCLKAL